MEISDKIKYQFHIDPIRNLSGSNYLSFGLHYALNKSDVFVINNIDNKFKIFIYQVIRDGDLECRFSKLVDVEDAASYFEICVAIDYVSQTQNSKNNKKEDVTSLLASFRNQLLRKCSYD
jgi:hypothetical protein